MHAYNGRAQWLAAFACGAYEHEWNLIGTIYVRLNEAIFFLLWTFFFIYKFDNGCGGIQLNLMWKLIYVFFIFLNYPKKIYRQQDFNFPI